jgi:hypothetical protein
MLDVRLADILQALFLDELRYTGEPARMSSGKASTSASTVSFSVSTVQLTCKYTKKDIS